MPKFFGVTERIVSAGSLFSWKLSDRNLREMKRLLRFCTGEQQYDGRKERPGFIATYTLHRIALPLPNSSNLSNSTRN
jgi:hypothetical protein